jgi:Mn-dependent DtxR family transcriptional regulator
MEKLEQNILSAMKQAGKPVKAAELAKTLGVDGKEVAKAFGSLKKQGKISSPKACYYEPTK